MRDVIRTLSVGQSSHILVMCHVCWFPAPGGTGREKLEEVRHSWRKKVTGKDP